MDRRDFIKKLGGLPLLIKLTSLDIGKREHADLNSQYVFNAGSARDITRDSSFFFRDLEGRYVLFRGVNWGPRSKLPPYLPNYPIADTALSDDKASDIRPGAIMKKMGFNIVRLCIMWKGLEPVPLTLNNNKTAELDKEGMQYLEQVGKIVEELNADGIFVIIDFHQDVAHELFNGDGFPDWAITAPKDSKKHVASDPKWGLSYYDFKSQHNSGMVRNTLRSFWQNSLTTEYAAKLSEYPVQDHLVNVIGQVAQYFMNSQSQSRVVVSDRKGHPAILGYEPFNEPHQVGTDKKMFESILLPAFYSKSVSQVRTTDPNAFLFLEPRVDWTAQSFYTDEPKHLLSAGSTLINEKEPARDIKSFLDVSSINDSKLIFSFHYYDPYTMFHQGVINSKLVSDSMKDKQRDWPALFKVLVDNGTSKNLMPFLTEFGGDQSWLKANSNIHNPAYHGKLLLAYQDLLFQQIEANMLNATYWNIDFYNTKEAGDNWNGENFSIISSDGTPLQDEIIVRPYPMRSSAKPTLLHFDVSTKHFVLSMEGMPVDAPSVVFVPLSQFPNKFEIYCNSNNGLVWDVTQQLLYWTPNKTQANHLLIICPTGKFDSSSLPAQTQNILPKYEQVTFVQKEN